MTNSNSNLKKTLEQREQRSKYLDGVIVQLQEELKRKQAEVAEMEAEYPPDDCYNDDAETEKVPYMTAEEIKSEFKRHLANLANALDSVEHAKDWILFMLDEHGKDNYASPLSNCDISNFMYDIFDKSDDIQGEICRLMDMVRDVETLVVKKTPYPIKKYC